MKKRVLKIIAITIAASMVFTSNTILANDDTPGVSDTAIEEAAVTSDSASDAVSTVLNLSLEDALNRIETGNSTMKLTDSKIAVYEKQYEQALARHDAKYTEVDENSAKVNKLNHKRALWNLENAKYDRETQLSELKVQTTNQYQNILALQKQADNLRIQLRNVDTMIGQVNLQMELGLLTESQIYALNAQKGYLEAGLGAAENNIKTAMIALKRDLGIDINQDVVLTSSLLPYEPFDDSKLEERIANAIVNDYTIQRQEKDIELTQIEYDIANYYDNASADQLEINIKNKKETLESLPVTKEVNLRTAYNTIKSLENTIKASRLQVEADTINVDIMQKKIDAGVSSSIEIIQLQNQLLNDEYTLVQNINAYMSAVASFENSLER